MKSTFNSLDIACAVYELQGLVGMRINQIYDLDPKTYIFKLHRKEEKAVLLLESGTRFHTTTFDWPKSNAPSGFTMKLRKHLRNKRIEGIHQLGKDRIVDFKFGSGDATYHVILELFNRGNIILLDHTLVTLNVLRPHTEGDKKFSVKEEYPVARVRMDTGPPSVGKLSDIFNTAKKGEKISKILLPHLDYGFALIEHLLVGAGLDKNIKYTGTIDQSLLDLLAEKLWIGEEIMKQISTIPTKGYIISKTEKRSGQEDLVTYQEFHPYLFSQHAAEQHSEYSSFNAAVDEFFSKTEGQKIELKGLQMEKEALLKVEKIKEDQKHRVEGLIHSQENNKRKGELIMANSELVDDVIAKVRRAISIQMPWPEINSFISELARCNHPIGKAIHKLKLEINHVTLELCDPYCDSDTNISDHGGSTLIDIDLALSACANASRYYLNKKSAEIKEKKTMEAQGKAVKSAEKKAKQTLKDIQTMTTITKARKIFWFEKFFWFISSDNFLVIGGRDQQQNEIIVKRYLRKGDLYVHADLHGASSIVIKNPKEEQVPPRTLNEAGNMAVSYSIGWEAKVMCSAWWVHYDQVSKTAPSGEYLTSGSFMIRGQKNYLVPAQLAMGFSFVFRVEESSAFRHKDERKAKVVDDSPNRDPPTLQDDSVEQELTSDGGDSASNTSEVGDQNENEADDNDDASDLDEKTAYTGGFPDAEVNLEHEVIKMNIEDTGSVSVSEHPYVIDLSKTGGRISTNPGMRQVKDSDRNGIKSRKNSGNQGKGNYIKRSEENKSVNQIATTETKEKSLLQEGQKSDSSVGNVTTENKEKSSLKRGQKSKLKKIKEKYKDQDEEEKQLRMSVLKSAGAKKEPKKSRKQEKPTVTSVEKKPPSAFNKLIKPAAKDLVETEAPDEDDITTDVDILDCLTGQPHPDDELLFAVPVVAPYSALLNYKYKVKLIPGNGKRGKCARSAVDYFTKLKECTPQEKASIRNVSDQILSRNFPGKVKVSLGPTKK